MNKRNGLLILVLSVAFSPTFAQVQLDNKIQLTGTGGNAKIEGIDEIINNSDAANKIYVDTAIANALSGGSCAELELPEAGEDQSVINGVTVNLTGNTPTLSTGQWSVHTGSGGSFGNASSSSTTFTGSDNSAYVLKWTFT